ncbi:MAG: hypothetical protein HYY84_12090 [Deltaproteobacteria bacterium]|nr:hypothetical protein [Deltaproteobacteria bacterium]
MTIEARIERAVGLALLHELNRARSGPTDAVGLRRAWESGGGAADEIRALARAVIEGPSSSIDVAALSRKLFREAPICIGDAGCAAPPWTKPGATFRDWNGAEKVRARLSESAREKAEAAGLPSESVVGAQGEDPIVIAAASGEAFVRELGIVAQLVWPEELWSAGKTIDAIPTWEAAAGAAAAGALCQVCGIAGADAGADAGRRCAGCEAAHASGVDLGPSGDRILWVAIGRPSAGGDGASLGADFSAGFVSRTRRHLFATIRGSNGDVDFAFRYAVARSSRLSEISSARGRAPAR